MGLWLEKKLNINRISHAKLIKQLSKRELPFFSKLVLLKNDRFDFYFLLFFHRYITKSIVLLIKRIIIVSRKLIYFPLLILPLTQDTLYATQKKSPNKSLGFSYQLKLSIISFKVMYQMTYHLIKVVKLYHLFYIFFLISHAKFYDKSAIL